MLFGAKADGKGTAGGDQARARMAQPDAQPETDGYGKNKDEIGAKRLRFPIEDVAVGEERGGAARLTSEAALSGQRLSDTRAFAWAEACVAGR